MIGTGKFDLVDLELSCGQERLLRLLRLAHEREMAVVISKHDFEKTPPEHEIICTLLEMERLGAELPKYAVMPQNVRDVLALLSATERALSLIHICVGCGVCTSLCAKNAIA